MKDILRETLLITLTMTPSTFMSPVFSGYSGHRLADSNIPQVLYLSHDEFVDEWRPTPTQ